MSAVWALTKHLQFYRYRLVCVKINHTFNKKSYYLVTIEYPCCDSQTQSLHNPLAERK